MSDEQPSPEALREHRLACDRNDAGYLDPDTRLFVMTSVYLLDQGECCGSGCRHCPYPSEDQAAAGRPAVGAWPYVPE